MILDYSPLKTELEPKATANTKRQLLLCANSTHTQAMHYHSDTRALREAT